jgi:hypothetical protein
MCTSRAVHICIVGVHVTAGRAAEDAVLTLSRMEAAMTRVGVHQYAAQSHQPGSDIGCNKHWNGHAIGPQKERLFEAKGL